MQRRQGRPNFSDDEFLVKVKDVVTGVRMKIGTGVIKAKCPSKSKDFGGHIVLTEDWARGVLKTMEWSKRKDSRGSFYLRRNLHSKDAFRRLFKNVT